LQNALSFVEQLSSAPKLHGQSIVICKKGSLLHDLCRKLGLEHRTVQPGRFGRFFFEFWGGYKIARSDKACIVFTLFGNAPLVSPGLYRISGFAWSNILHPEVPFWDFLPLFRQKLKELKDRVRLWASRQSHEIIVETAFLAKRARNGPFADRKVHVVKMEPSSLVRRELKNRHLERKEHNFISILYLSGPHPNKRIHLLASIFVELNRLARANKSLSYKLTVTLPPSHNYTNEVFARFKRINAFQYIDNLGVVHPNEVGKLLRRVDGVVNIARLESFSNNWVEAWVSDLPLISVNADWARASCGDAAIYIDVMDAKAAAKTIYDMYSDTTKIKTLIRASRDHLSKLGAPGDKFDAYTLIILAALNRPTVKK